MVVLIALLTTIVIIVLLCLATSPFDIEEFPETYRICNSWLLLLITLVIVLIGIRESCY